MSTLPLRPARTTDPAEVDRLYEICLRTGASGADASGLYADQRLLGHSYFFKIISSDIFISFKPGFFAVDMRNGLYSVKAIRQFKHILTYIRMGI